jgi:hypothetical protein
MLKGDATCQHLAGAPAAHCQAALAGGPPATRRDETQALEFWSDFSSFIAW